MQEVGQVIAGRLEAILVRWEARATDEAVPAEAEDVGDFDDT